MCGKMRRGKKANAKGRIVLVGTYKSDQLTKWRGWYNYPISDSDLFHAETQRRGENGLVTNCDKSWFSKINELWLFKGKKEERRYKAEFVGVKTRQELISDYGYLAKGKAHGDKYLLFKTDFKYQHKGDVPEDAERVIIRTADFATAPKVRKQLKAYLESSDRKDPDLAKRLPTILTKLRPEQLRVCEAAVQITFLPQLYPQNVMEYSKTNPKHYRIVSLFAGCGGLDLGFLGGFDFLGKRFKRTAFDIVWANEWNPAACKTYSRNLGPHVVCGDIKDAIKDIPDNVDMIMGGFPCQDISINGKMLGIKGKRSSLYRYIVDAVRRCHPKVFLAENVGSLLLKQNEYSFKKILADFKALDYNVTYKVYHAEEYGVPQTRERIIFIGTRKDLAPFVHPLPTTAIPITAGEALHDLENCPQDRGFSHVWSVAAASGEQGSRKMVEDRPGYTIRAECHGNIHFHYKLPRRLSMREAARIQSFPDSFVFPCGIRETERQVGNAVPPVLAWHIANALQKYLEAAK